MRFIFAFFLGILATFGGAFYHDALLPESERSKSRLVNWSTLSEFAQSSVDRAHDELNKMMSK